MRRTWSSKWVSWVESWLAMNDGDEHEVPRPKLVRTGCRLFWHRDWVWEGDTRGEWSIAESEILWGERGYISMKWGLERWWVMMMMMWWSVWGSEISCDEWGYISMKWGLERWWVMSWWTVFSLQFKFHVMNDQLSLWNEVRMDSCVRVVMYCECSLFSTIQISCDEWPTISMKWS